MFYVYPQSTDGLQLAFVFLSQNESYFQLWGDCCKCLTVYAKENRETFHCINFSSSTTADPRSIASVYMKLYTLKISIRMLASKIS